MTAPTLAQPQPTSPPADHSHAAEIAAAVAVIAAYQASTAAVRTQLEGFIRALWTSLGTYRSPQMREFTGQALPTVQGAMGHMADLTSGYLAALADVHGQPTPAGPSRAPTIARVRNGVDPTEVYERPFHLVWRQLAELPRQPGSIEQAIKAGEDRAVQTSLTDVQLAKTHTAQQAIAHDRHIVGYRRVLEGAYSCGLCIVAATLRYHKAKLLAIHPACDCGIEPMWGTEDTGKTVDVVRRGSDGELVPIGELGDVHQAIADRFGRSSAAARNIPGVRDGKGNPLQYRDAIIIHDHGELGPVIGVRGVDWVGPNDLNK